MGKQASDGQMWSDGELPCDVGQSWGTKMMSSALGKEPELDKQSTRIDG